VRSVPIFLTETRTLPNFHVYTSRTADTDSSRVAGAIGNVSEIEDARSSVPRNPSFERSRAPWMHDWSLDLIHHY